MVQFASNLHLEFLEHNFTRARLAEPAPGADLLLLAGDIHNGCKGIKAFADWPVPVRYLAGNHQCCGGDWEPIRRDIRAACAGTRVTFVGNDSVDYRIGRCRVFANPAGYILNRAAATAVPDFCFENGKFDPGLVVEVTA